MSTRTGIEHEETLLHESAARESSLNTQVINMETELKSARTEVRRLQTEKESYEQVRRLFYFARRLTEIFQSIGDSPK